MREEILEQIARLRKNLEKKALDKLKKTAFPRFFAEVIARKRSAIARVDTNPVANIDSTTAKQTDLDSASSGGGGGGGDSSIVGAAAVAGSIGKSSGTGGLSAIDIAVGAAGAGLAITAIIASISKASVTTNIINGTTFQISSITLQPDKETIQISFTPALTISTNDRVTITNTDCQPTTTNSISYDNPNGINGLSGNPIKSISAGNIMMALLPNMTLTNICTKGTMNINTTFQSQIDLDTTPELNSINGFSNLLGGISSGLGITPSFIYYGIVGIIVLILIFMNI